MNNTNSNISFCIFLVLTLINTAAITQDCLEFPPLDGIECMGCAPEGWEVINSPDIVPENGSWQGGGCTIDWSGPPPGGGSAVLMAATGTGYAEGITTTIDDLIVGSDYGFAVYWEIVSTINCGMYDAGELLVELDGEQYVFSGAEEWEFVEFCFTASSSSVELSISNGGDELGIIMVDSPECEMVTPCCALLLEIAEEEYEICPGEDIELITEYFEEEGDVQIIWDCDPSSGLDYLDDPEILSPIFNFPYDDDFEGGSYTFTVTVEDESCSRSAEILVVVNNNEEPEFDIDLCELNDESIFPNESDNGFLGTWTGDFDFDELAGSVQEYVFTLDLGQENCTQIWTYSFLIEEAIELQFLEENIYCEKDDQEYRLPDESEDRIEGVWDFNSFVPAELGSGYHEFTFFPDLEEACALEYVFEIRVLDADSLDFDLPDEYCLQNDTIFLPDTSLMGIVGAWEQPFIDLQNQSQDVSIGFIPADDNGCFHDYQYSYSVQSSVSLNFDLPDTLCITESMFIPEPVSGTGIEGSWTPVQIDFDSILPGLFELIWQPIEMDSSCVSDTSVSVYIEDVIVPSFDHVDSLCQDHGIYNLNSESLNGIIGTWDVPGFNTADLNPGPFMVNFTPESDYCSVPVEIEIEIIENAEAEFQLPDSICQNQNAILLSEISENDVSGNWSVNPVEPAFIMDSLTVVFTPSTDQNGCVTGTSHTFYISNFSTPEFDLPDVLCFSVGEYVFPQTSLSGISGSWDIEVFDPSDMSFNDLLENSFTPDDLSCYQIAIVSIPLIDLSGVDLDLDPISSCVDQTASLIVTDQDLDIAFSIDGGSSWNNEGDIVFLQSGQYDVLVQDNGQNCEESFMIDVVPLEPPSIDDVILIHESSCEGGDASIEIISFDTDLEYSIDNGNNWSGSNLFDDLDSGVYEIMIRSSIYEDCVDFAEVEIDAFPDTRLVDIETTDPDDCGADTGEIRIMAEGQDLEYSIDRGQTWQDDPVFNDLVAADYDVIVRSRVDINCTDQELIRLSDPESPEILSADVRDPECGKENGSIELLLSIADVEYSINGSAQWEDNQLITGLSAGEYLITIRSIDASSCMDTIRLIVNEAECPCEDIELAFEISPVDCLNPSSGFAEITEINGIDTNDPYTVIWDDGNTSETALDLTEGWHVLEIQYGIDCIHHDSVYIDSVDPVTFDLLAYDQDCTELGSIEITNFMGGEGQPMYSIDGINFQEDAVFTNLTADQYQVFVESLFNCNDVDSIVINDNTDLQLDLPVIQPIQIGESTILNPLINQSTIDNFEWSPIEGILNPGNLIAEVAPVETTTYTLTIYFGDCIETRSITVEVIGTDKIYVADIFSPNGDGNNDRIFPQSSSFLNILVDEFAIYDRWGNLVYLNTRFPMNDADQGWDGYYNDREVEIGVYAYMLSYTLNGSKLIKAGSITLVR